MNTLQQTARICGLLLTFVLISSITLLAQDTTAIMDLESSSQGVLLPRMNTVQRKAINNPANALTVYDTVTGTFWYNKIDEWLEIRSRPMPLDVSGSNTTGFTIPAPGSVSSTVALTSPDVISSITQIEVCLNINHNFPVALDISLVSPGGVVTLDLSSNNGGSGSNYANTCFTTYATIPITSGSPPFTGDFIPESSFSLLAGQPIDGIWTLSIYNTLDFFGGTLVDWSIRFCSGTEDFHHARFNGDVEFNHHARFNGEVEFNNELEINDEAEFNEYVEFDDSTLFDGPVKINNCVEIGTSNSGYPGDLTQLLLSGVVDVGTNLGSVEGTAKLRVEGYNNDEGLTVFPIYVIDEDDQVDFYLKNRQHVWDIPSAYFGGNVGIGTQTPTAMLEVNAEVVKKINGGSWTASSDRRLKKEIKDYTAGLDDVLDMHPVIFKYNKLSGYDQTSEHVGIIAQDLQKIAPYMVSTFKQGDKEYLQVDNSAMTYMLINAVKELKAENEELKLKLSEIDELKQKLSELTNALIKSNQLDNRLEIDP